jgi:arachidonate 15-lipoxygenase
MSLSSVGQNDIAKGPVREGESAVVDKRYQYSHRYVYDDGLVLEPIAVLKVDPPPFPENQKLNLVQVLEVADTVLPLITNIIVMLTNLLGVGSVPSVTPEGDAVGRALDELKEHHRRLGQLLIEANAAIERTSQLSIDSSRADSLGSALKEALEFLLELVGQIAGLYGTPHSIREYAAQFQTIVVPEVLSSWQSDEEFALMRVAGPNPLMIQRVIERLPPNFPVRDEAYRRVVGADDGLALAIAEGRLYYVDYRALSVLIAGNTGGQQKYITAPLALFAVPRGGGLLEPIAIQCGQEPNTRTPVIYPFDDREAWSLAKVHVQVADGNYHELVSHLGLTHLLIEPFVVSTHRMLASDHPLSILLMPSFQGTLFINNAAIKTLINPGGTVDRLLAGTIESDWRLTTSALGELDFDRHMLPRELAARGVASSDLPLQYPYRDDALDLWNAIRQWAHDYLALYYSNDDAVSSDTQLQAWVQNLTSESGGRIRGLGQPLNASTGIATFDYLVDVATMVIFTASVQHAAVNFPQSSIMSYTPAMPLAAYAPAPTRTSGVDPQQGMLQTLPPLQQAMLQLVVGQTLGGVYFTRLGDYDRHLRGSYFGDPRVRGPLTSYQDALEVIERSIGERNMLRPSYTTLLPSRIPQSINI